MRSVRAMLTSAAFACALVLAAPAAAQAITGGTTDVTLTAAPTLTGLGLTVAPTGTATATLNSDGLPVVTFPITGGSVDSNTGDALIFHDGSGLSFTGGGSTLLIGNFVIDTANLLVSGDTTANGTGLGIVPLFDLGAGNTLLLTTEASGAFQTLFNANLPAGTNVGFATVNPTLAAAVPEPGTWAMMLFGFGTLGLAFRRRQAAAVATA